MRTKDDLTALSFCLLCALMIGLDGCSEPRTGNSPSIHVDQPAAKAPSINASDIQAPTLGQSAPRAPSINASQERADAGVTKP